MIMMSVVVSVSVIVIRVGIDMLFSNKQKTNKQRIMNHEDYAPTILVYHHLTIPGKQERKKKENQKKKSQIYPTFVLTCCLLYYILFPTYNLLYPYPYQVYTTLNLFIILCGGLQLNVDLCTYG